MATPLPYDRDPELLGQVHIVDPLNNLTA